MGAITAMRRLEAIVRPTSMECRRVWWRISKALAVTCFAGERIRASPGFGGRSGLFFDGDIRKEHGCVEHRNSPHAREGQETARPSARVSKEKRLVFAWRSEPIGVEWSSLF